MNAIDIYDLDVFNSGGEDVPALGVMQVNNIKLDLRGRDYFEIGKPDGSGKFFIVNQPFKLPAGAAGRGTRTHGAPVLCDPETAPDIHDEIGPIDGEWYATAEGKGLAVVAQGGGQAASEPGFPVSPASKWCRVAFPNGGGGGSALKHALITETIPAGTSDGAAVEATPGVGGQVWLLKWNDDGDKLVKNDDEAIEGVNASRTEIRATSSEPIHALGFVETVDDAKRFVVCNVVDPRGFTNYGKATKQALFHDADSEHFQLGGEDCPDEG